MSTNILAHLNESVRAAQRYDESKPVNIPFWRNFYILSIKQSRTQVPITKKVYIEGGFKAAKTFCQMYCDRLGYQFLTLCPEVSDLLFELNGDDAFKNEQIDIDSSEAKVDRLLGLANK